MQRAIRPLRRANVSDTVADAVRTMIVDGRLAEGARINEVHLSQRLGVSRTPLREALNRLASEGALASAPSHGFSVRPLTLAEFEPLYAMRPILDPAALKLAGLPSPERLAELRALNARIEASRDVARTMDLDDAWHMLLIAGCPNPILLELVAQFIARTRRYEIALMRERREVLAAGTNHRAVMAALRRRDLGGACAALKHNLERGAAPMAAWLTAREAERSRT
jgi:DNA-binding GntR family transcriptional regulator